MDITIPSIGESVVEVLVAKWHVTSGELVRKDDLLCEIETDKITLGLHADGGGVLRILVPEGGTVAVGAVIGSIEEQKSGATDTPVAVSSGITPPSSPEVRKRAAEQGVDLATIPGSGKSGRVTVDDLAKVTERDQSSKEEISSPLDPQTSNLSKASSVRSEEQAPYGVKRDQVGSVLTSEASASTLRQRRVPMSPIRKRIAERLLMARQQTAMLTTFNEADMGPILALRQKYREHFLQKFGFKPGLMPFFVKACCESLREFPEVNARIDGNDIVYNDYFDIGIAIGGEKGLVVPVLRDADRLRFREIDEQISAYTAKVKENRLAMADLEGGTFTISNGGVYGSLLSTPIINPPQSAVLGMHAIQQRPVVRDGEIVIRSMMYLALSYDHRLIDGRKAVEFLKRVKELVEEPEELLLEG